MLILDIIILQQTLEIQVILECSSMSLIKMNDKLQHGIVCYCIVLTLAILGNMIAGLIFALLFSFGKEIYDGYQKGNKFDWWDILADFIGIGLGVLISQSITLT